MEDSDVPVPDDCSGRESNSPEPDEPKVEDPLAGVPVEVSGPANSPPCSSRELCRSRCEVEGFTEPDEDPI